MGRAFGPRDVLSTLTQADGLGWDDLRLWRWDSSSPDVREFTSDGEPRLVRNRFSGLREAGGLVYLGLQPLKGLAKAAGGA
jgi:hypothetical protein